MVYIIGRKVKKPEYVTVRSGNRVYFMDSHIKDKNLREI